MTRDQFRQYFDLTVHNANRILRNLSEYLHSYRDGYQSIYYLNSLGREYVDCEKGRKKTTQVQHIIMRNQLWLFYNCPSEWKNEVKITNDKTTIIADAFFMINGFYNFLEVDNLQPMKENRAKIKRYKELMDSLVKQFSYYPTIVWVTTTEHRKMLIMKECEGLKVKVYTIDEIK